MYRLMNSRDTDFTGPVNIVIRVNSTMLLNWQNGHRTYKCKSKMSFSFRYHTVSPMQRKTGDWSS